MNEDRLLSALRAIGDQELPTASDRAIRGRLEAAWVRSAGRTSGSRIGIRRWSPVLAGAVLLLGVGWSALGSGADSPLWETRVALEGIGAFVRSSPADRVAYLLDLVQSRTEEAARQEAAGNAGAAAKARAAASSAISQLGGNPPQLEATVVIPTASPTSSPERSTVPTVVPSATPSRSPEPTLAPGPLRTAPPTPVASPVVTPVPTLIRTEPPRTPSPTPTATKQSTNIVGTVRDAAGIGVTDACITTSPNVPTSVTSCITKTSNGSYSFSASITPGQTVTLYAYWTSSTGQNFVGSATTTATVPTTVMPGITLTPRR